MLDSKKCQSRTVPALQKALSGQQQCSRAGLCRWMCRGALGRETRRDKQINRRRQISSEIVISLLKLP